MNLEIEFNLETKPLSTSLPVTQLNIKQKQTTLHSFFVTKPPLAHTAGTQLIPAIMPRSVPRQCTARHMAVRQHLLQYNRLPRQSNKILCHTKQCPQQDLFNSLCHSLSTIQPNNTLCIFLQNPNGLSIHANKHALLQDFQVCQDYGAGVICLPKTNTNWDQDGQISALSSIFCSIWQNTVLQTSRAPEDFISICDNWVSKLHAKGEDPMGLGCWSYIMLNGTGNTKITIITAYNASPASGDGTFFQQQ
jgi:hypothetical protein